MNYKKKAQDIYNRMIDCGIATSEQIEGCSEEEVLLLETKYNLCLPSSYKTFLRIFGHKCGFFMEDIDIFYDEIVDETNFVMKKVFTGKDNPSMLPKNIFVFAARYGEQFWFFDVDLDEEDPPYYHYYWDDDEEVIKYDESMWLFIESELIMMEKMRDELGVKKLKGI